jgi:hypothetical protein
MPPPMTPTNTPNNEGLPPPNSLLFSANPKTHLLIPNDALTCSFLPSRYQTAPPAGTWGNVPWGMFYKESLARPSSPCIIDFGQEGSQPLYLPDPINNITCTSPRLPTSPPSQLSRNFGQEDLTWYKKEDLSGAVYADDNPLNAFKPTIQMVDEYCRNQDYRDKTLRDLGVSAKGGGNVMD